MREHTACDLLTLKVGLWPLERSSGELIFCSSLGGGGFSEGASSDGKLRGHTALGRTFREDCRRFPWSLFEPQALLISQTPPGRPHLGNSMAKSLST